MMAALVAGAVVGCAEPDTVGFPPGQVYIRMVRCADPAAVDQLIGGLQGPGVSQSPVDVHAALLKAAGDGYKYVLVADFSKDYYILPRRDSE